MILIFLIILGSSVVLFNVHSVALSVSEYKQRPQQVRFLYNLNLNLYVSVLQFSGGERKSVQWWKKIHCWYLRFWSRKCALQMDLVWQGLGTSDTFAGSESTELISGFFCFPNRTSGGWMGVERSVDGKGLVSKVLISQHGGV